MPESKEVPAWTYEHPSDHPDNKPPVTIVAVPSDEAKADYEKRMNMAIEAGQPESLTKVQDMSAPPIKVQLVDGDKDKATATNYDEQTVAELKEVAANKGVEVKWDDTKADIIKALEKHDKKAK
jgi:hypothetical protein